MLAPVSGWASDAAARSNDGYRNYSTLERIVALMIGISVLFTIIPDGLDFTHLDQLGPQGTDFGLVARVQWFPFFAISAVILAMRWRLTWALTAHINPFLLLVMAWILASTIWSNDPSLTLRRGVKITGMLMVVLAYFVVCTQPSGFLKVLRDTAAFSCAASIVFVLVMPQYGVHQGIAEPGLKGAWRGITNHKNALGMIASISSLLWVHAWASREVAFRYCIAPLVVTFIALLGSSSTTALVSSFITTSIACYFLRAPPFMRSSGFLLPVVAMVVGLILTLFIFIGIPTPLEALGMLAGSFGKDATLTGRDAIWAALIPEIAAKPWIGNGFNAFWISQTMDSPSANVMRTINFAPLQAHNGYFEILVELGGIGFTLLILMLGYQVLQFRQVWKLQIGIASLGASYFFYDLIINITESNFLRPTFTPCMIEFLMAGACARVLLQRRIDQQLQTKSLLP